MTIQLHGKEYVEVKDRVAAALAEERYSMLKEETFEMGGRSYVRLFIDVKGEQYIGTAEIKFNAKANTPDGMSPFECGETSALGRALGFAGYGVVDSIASADEVTSNQQQQNGNAKPAQNGNGNVVQPAPGTSGAIVRMVEIARARADKLDADWDLLKTSVLGEPVPDSKLIVHHFTKINGELTKRERATSGT